MVCEGVLAMSCELDERKKHTEPNEYVKECRNIPRAPSGETSGETSMQ